MSGLWFLLAVVSNPGDQPVPPSSSPSPSQVQLQGLPCPAAKDLPQLTIADVKNPAVPLIDKWQVLLNNVALSDSQVAQLAGHDTFIERTREEMDSRGTWVYVGLGTAAAGAALSSAGWVLYGQNEISQGITLPIAVTGLLVTLVGIIFATENIQTPLEPHLAPTPTHRLTRDETRTLVAKINKRLHQDICAAAQKVSP